MDSHFYLKHLIIQNFATFKNQQIRFKPGFNAIVGETGSGKSLVLDALQLILGGRADKKVVRRETEYSLIEASFHCQDQEVKKFLEREGFPIESHELVIKRLIYKNGSTKTYINHLSSTVSFLASFSRRYIDLVGQFENQKLLSESYQLQLLDQFAKLQPEAKIFQNLFHDYQKLKKERSDLEQSKNMREQRIDYLNYQLQEVEKLNPSSQDEEDLLKRKHLMINTEKTQKLCYQAKDIFEGSEGQSGLLSQMRFLSSLFLKNPDLFQDQSDSVSQVIDQLDLLQSDIEKKMNFEFDPEEMEQAIERLDMYQRLKKKFGGTVETILQAQVEFLKERNQLEELEVNLDGLNGKMDVLSKDLTTKAQALHQRRKKAAKSLGDELTKRVRLLKMTGSTLNMEIHESEELHESGISKASFIAETNSGEGFYKVKDIASGGELSRILLALRQILSSYDSISIFLFDEIDTGIGGETANCIGKALMEVGSNGQVIAITHLPQIAQFAEALILVQKEVQANENRTESVVKEIFGKMIQKEVKAMAQLH